MKSQYNKYLSRLVTVCCFLMYLIVCTIYHCTVLVHPTLYLIVHTTLCSTVHPTLYSIVHTTLYSIVQQEVLYYSRKYCAVQQDVLKCTVLPTRYSVGCTILHNAVLYYTVQYSTYCIVQDSTYCTARYSTFWTGISSHCLHILQCPQVNPCHQEISRFLKLKTLLRGCSSKYIIAFYLCICKLKLY